MSKEMVFKSSMEDGRSKIRAMKAVAGSGVDSIEVDMAEGKLTAVGDVDPVYLAQKLRQMGYRAELLSVGPSKKEKKKEESPTVVYHMNPSAYAGYPLYAPVVIDEKKEEESPTVVYHTNPSAYAGYPSYTVVRDEYPSGCTIL